MEQSEDSRSLANSEGTSLRASRSLISADTFERIKLLGMGDVGRVYLVRHRASGQLFAMKVLDKAVMIKRDKIRRSLTEHNILATVDHPLIVRLHWAFQSVERLYFVMDYCAGGSLFRYVHRQPNKCLPEDHVRFYMAEILLALEYLHLNGFIYRDLKSENVLIQASGHIMLTDFDLSTSGDSETKVKADHRHHEVFAHPLTHSNSFVGTLEYLAPEVIKGSNQSSSVDWWTFGILMYELLYGVTPYESKVHDRSTEAMCSTILEGELHFPEKPNPVSHDCKSLIRKLLNADPKKRLGTHHDAGDVKRHKFFHSINFILILNSRPPYVPPLTGATDTSQFDSFDGDIGDSVETDSELSEDDLRAGPFRDFTQINNEAKLHRRSSSAQGPAALGLSSASQDQELEQQTGMLGLLHIGSSGVLHGHQHHFLRRSGETHRGHA